MKPTIRKVRTREFQLAANLMNSVYARKKKSDYFLWQYAHTPFPSTLYGAFLGKKLVGMIGIQTRTLSNRAHLGLVMDIVVHEDYRSQGIFFLLAQYLIKQNKKLDGLCSFTNTLGMKVCVEKLGWKLVEKIDMQILNLNKTPKRIKMVKHSNRKMIGFSYNKQIVDWRFTKAPHYHYDTIPSGKAFSKVKLFTDPVTHKVYGDIVYISDQKMLLTSVFKYFKTKNVREVTSWALPHTNLFSSFRKKGFVSMPAERYFCLKINNPKYNNLYSVEAWSLFQADSDVF